MLTVMALGPDSSFKAFLLSTNLPVFRMERSPLVTARCRTDDARVAATIYHKTDAAAATRGTAAKATGNISTKNHAAVVTNRGVMSERREVSAGCAAIILYLN